jgi:hypothetical protein
MRRAASLALLALLAAVPANAQTPTPGGGRQTIEFLYNRLLALEARVAQVESRADDDIEESDLVGRYYLTVLGIEMGQAPYLKTTTDSVIITLHADHSVTGTPVDTPGHCTLQFAGVWSVTCEALEPESAPTWRYENGYLILTDDEGDEEFLVSAGGRTFLGAGTTNFLPGHGWSAILLGSRLPD